MIMWNTHRHKHEHSYTRTRKHRHLCEENASNSLESLANKWHNTCPQVVQLTKFDYRLSSDLDEDLQKLRCRVNYHALRFTKTLRSLGQRLVMRMRKMAKRFIAIHLRFVILVKLYKFLFCLVFSLQALNAWKVYHNSFSISFSYFFKQSRWTWRKIFPISLF